MTIERTPSRIARGTRPPASGLTLVLSGKNVVRRGGREEVIHAGEVTLLHSQDRWEKEMSAGYSEQFLYLPESYLRSISTNLGPRGEIRVPRSGLGQFVVDSVASLRRNRANLNAGDLPVLLDSIARLLPVVFAEKPDRDEIRPSARELIRRRVLDFVDQSLADPELAPPVIAACRMSVRYLHSLFEDTSTTIGALILERRLERAKALLGDPMQLHRRVSEIAFDVGFNDAAHFSRTFKARFGMTPREARMDPYPAAVTTKE